MTPLIDYAALFICVVTHGSRPVRHRRAVLGGGLDRAGGHSDVGVYDVSLPCHLTVHSFGRLRCRIKSSSGYTWAELHEVDDNNNEVVNIYLYTPTEIVAWTALSEALTKQDGPIINEKETPCPSHPFPIL